MRDYGSYDKVSFTTEEIDRLKNVFWVVTKGLYQKIISGGVTTEYMHDKVMKKIEEAEEWAKNNASVKMEGSDTLLIDNSLESIDETI